MLLGLTPFDVIVVGRFADGVVAATVLALHVVGDVSARANALLVYHHVLTAIHGTSPSIVAGSYACVGLVGQVVFHLLPDLLEQLYVLGAIDAHLVHSLGVFVQDNLLPEAKFGLYLATQAKVLGDVVQLVRIEQELVSSPFKRVYRPILGHGVKTVENGPSANPGHIKLVPVMEDNLIGFVGNFDELLEELLVALVAVPT